MSRPNVVLIVMDTARAAAVERLAELDDGFFADTDWTYTNAVSASPWTLPSHASLFTGTYPSNHGAHAGHKRLEADRPVLAEVLAATGYETVAVSNNTWISEEFGFGRGFETLYKTWQYVQSETDLGRIAREAEGMEKLTRAARAIFDGNPVTNLANAVYGQFHRRAEDDGAARTNAWIDDWLAGRDGDRPFFLFVNYLEPHLEYRPPRRHAERHLPDDISYEAAMDVPQDAWGHIAGTVELSEDDFEVLRALYRAEIDYLGERIEELARMLADACEWEDTLFVLTSDHGENIGEHGLMDHQYALYDTLLDVPLFVRGGPFEGGRIDDLVQLVDLPPTILDALDIDAPEFCAGMQGRSFHPDAGAEPREYVIAEYLAPQPSMVALEKRVGEIPDQVLQYDRSLRAIRTQSHKFIRGSDGSREFYDLRSDPGETNDVADANRDIVKTLDRTLDEWLDSFDHAEHAGDVAMSADARDRLEDLGYLQ